MTCPFQIHETPGHFHLSRPVTANEILTMAKKLVKNKFVRGQTLTTPETTKDFLMLELALLEQEVFFCIFLDNQHQVIKAECCFRGTINGANVHPREVVKRALQLNAKAVIFAHKHPSGIAKPSEDDRVITRRLIDALGLMDIRVLDHFIISGVDYFSFAEAGLL